MKYERPQSMSLEWKEFKVDLGLATEHIKELSSKIIGSSGERNQFVVWYREDLSDDERASIQTYWDSLTPEHEHCKSYMSLEDRDSMIKQAKLIMVSKTWANMKAAERKLCMGLDEEVSNADLASLLE